MAEDLIWSRVDAAGARARPALDFTRIVEASIRIADADGLDGISMRRVAEELGAGTMSLYRYVSSKDDLLDLMLDAAYGEIAVPARHGRNWRTDVRALAIRTRRVWKRHPWIGGLLTARPTMGPNYLCWFEFSLAAVAAPGRDMQTMVRAVGTVHAYVAGVVGYELGDAESNRRHGMTEAQKRAAIAPYLERILATGRFPQLARFVEEGSGASTDADFEFGLDCVLDGVERALRRGRRRVR